MEVVTMTLHHHTIIVHLIPPIDLPPKSPQAAPQEMIPSRAGDRAFGLAQPEVQQLVTLWEHVETRTEVRRRRRDRRAEVAGSVEAMQAKDPQVLDDLEAQTRQHQVLPDTTAQDLGQQGDAELDDKIDDEDLYGSGNKNDTETTSDQHDISEFVNTNALIQISCC